jgi:hypothetical protein
MSSFRDTKEQDSITHSMCARACSLNYPACSASPYFHLAPPNFSTLSHKRHDFRGGGGGGNQRNMKFVFLFSLQFILKNPHYKNN